MSEQTKKTPQRVRKFLPNVIESSSRSSRNRQSPPSAQASSAEQAVKSGTPAGTLIADTRPASSHDLTGSQRQQDDSLIPNVIEDSDNRICGLSQRQLIREEVLHNSVDTKTHRDRLPYPVSSSAAKKVVLQMQSCPRKFAPQLVETNKRSFRRKETSHALSEAPVHGYDNGSRTQSGTSTCANSDTSSATIESKFSYSSLQQRQESRSHSFRVPDLPAIPSSCSDASEGSEIPSLSASPSVSSNVSAHHSKAENSCQTGRDGHMAEYFLSLAAQSVENQLKEQALAAFPNEQVYEPVDHFAIDKDEDECSEDSKSGLLHVSRRESSADLPWELEHMRRHKEDAEMRDRAMAGTKGTRPPSAIFNPRQFYNVIDNDCWRGKYEPDLSRHLARPPMLGDDLVFPQSLSPEATMCESGSVRDCATDSRHRVCNDSGLWCTQPDHVQDDATTGLWKGTCCNHKHAHQSKESLPCVPDNSHRYNNNECQSKVCSDEQDQDQFTSSSSCHLALDVGELSRHDIDNEHHDCCFGVDDNFVTQIYNYLSLGYPCVARYYDHELSRVSGIPVKELRRGDTSALARGYLQVNEDGSANGPVVRQVCARWVALRLYIHDWARSQPNFDNDNDHDTWGVLERRGSWAI
ncbi:hypothetical protein ALT_9376 [Aspergillus lentulus]|uniref:Uncharacterized protein n=1 Tax=Aspergillus lentulus TaxID=293939 RepID=A0AAN6BQY5_ASPLE|nr:hypothetical protein CNMCM6069_004501 [Aspergillus lentulus]KAF4159559.1 hypothetical protein CNMCM6936_004346 [Aspergillus lentulus]KAF4176704.1 hypothetical protein CNMCM8060_005981 [Aspergillus lentulus]KAF4181645.1 hypothetical protein CNMCM7927_000524 [Aspergillus lentulus]KAF4195705.1 hypothetical protein CNMCM8694_005978 [Aspergillus lentulus]